MKNHYRIVHKPKATYFKYHVECWRWWFPFWIEVYCGWGKTVTECEAIAHQHASGYVVKYL